MRPRDPGHAAARRRAPVRLLALALCLMGLGASGLGAVSEAQAVPSAVVHYGPSLPASLDQYAAPGNVIVVTAEQRNRNPARIRAWRAKGANVFAYVNLVYWRGPSTRSSRPSTAAASRRRGLLGSYSNYPGTRLLNLQDTARWPPTTDSPGPGASTRRAGSATGVIADGSLFNGVFLDVWGDQLYEVPVGGPGTHWEAGVAEWGQQMRPWSGRRSSWWRTTPRATRRAAALNGRVWESFESRRSGYNDLTGLGTHPGLVDRLPVAGVAQAPARHPVAQRGHSHAGHQGHAPGRGPARQRDRQRRGDRLVGPPGRLPGALRERRQRAARVLRAGGAGDHGTRTTTTARTTVARTATGPTTSGCRGSTGAGARRRWPPAASRRR